MAKSKEEAVVQKAENAKEPKVQKVAAAKDAKPSNKKELAVAQKVEAIKEPNRIKERYKEEIVPALIKTFGYDTVMQVPKLDKIVLNMRLGDVKDNPKSMQLAIQELELIAGQKAMVTRARKSVANFKVRAKQDVGAMITLRAERMWSFLDKLVSIALPRVRDFRGISAKSFDGRGNYALGIKEQLIFPEISYDQVEKVRGFDICFVTTAKTDEEARELFKLLGMPFAAK